MDKLYCLDDTVKTVVVRATFEGIIITCFIPFQTCLKSVMTINYNLEFITIQFDGCPCTSPEYIKK